MGSSTPVLRGPWEQVRCWILNLDIELNSQLSQVKENLYFSFLHWEQLGCLSLQGYKVIVLYHVWHAPDSTAENEVLVYVVTRDCSLCVSWLRYSDQCIPTGLDNMR